MHILGYVGQEICLKENTKMSNIRLYNCKTMTNKKTTWRFNNSSKIHRTSCPVGLLNLEHYSVIHLNYFFLVKTFLCHEIRSRSFKVQPKISFQHGDKR